jgi:hypothetical protein
MVVSVNRHFSGILMQSVILAAVALLSKRDINWIVRQFNFCLSVRCEAYIQLFRNQNQQDFVRIYDGTSTDHKLIAALSGSDNRIGSFVVWTKIHVHSFRLGFLGSLQTDSMQQFESRGKRPVSITIWQCIKCVDEFAQFIADYDSLCDLSFDALVLRISLAVQTVE